MKNLIVSGITGNVPAALKIVNRNEELVIVNRANSKRISNASGINKFEIFSSNGMLIKSIRYSDAEVSIDISGLKSVIYSEGLYLLWNKNW